MRDQRTNQPAAAPPAVFTGVLEPGNGGRYEYAVWMTADGQWYAAFPDFGRASRIGCGEHHASYVQEKFHCSAPDAEVMTSIINGCILRKESEA